MALLIHRTTFETKYDDPNDHPLADYIQRGRGADNSDLDALVNIPKKYWKVVDDDRLAAMDTGERAVVDAAAVPSLKGAALSALGLQVTEYIGAKYSEPLQRTLLALEQKARADGKINKANYIKQLFDWAENVLGYYVTKAGELSAAADVAALTAISIDLTQFDASDPQIKLPNVLAITD